MDSTTTLLCLLGVFSLMSCAPVVRNDCNNVCESEHFQHHSAYHLILELQNSSIAPWTKKVSIVRGWPMEEVECSDCKQPGLISKPIYVKLYQTKQVSNHLCHCSFQVAVGCTCIIK